MRVILSLKGMGGAEGREWSNGKTLNDPVNRLFHHLQGVFFLYIGILIDFKNKFLKKFCVDTVI